MTPEFYHKHFIVPTLRLLNPKFQGPKAEAMLLAIAMQESDLRNRKQVRGPAKGYYQFELIGVRGSMLHHRTGKDVRFFAEFLGYANFEQAYMGIEDSDTLATVFARYNLYNFPGPLPDKRNHLEGFRQYLARWRPGKPKPSRWKERYDRAWSIVENYYAR